MKLLILDDRPLQATAAGRLVATRRPDISLTLVATPAEAMRLLPLAETVVCTAQHLLAALQLALHEAGRLDVTLCSYREPTDLRSIALLFGGGNADPRLTAREAEVMALLEHGMPNKLIARRLSLSLPTVKTHLANIFRKLGAQSRLQAICRARDSFTLQEAA
jgi:DNA-binding CsgD family transcriptional regulator